MLSSFTNSFKNFVFGSSNDANNFNPNYSRKRLRDENCDLNGEEAEDILNSRSAKKIKTDASGSFSIRGMPSMLKKRMAKLLDTQKDRRRPSPLPEDISQSQDLTPAEFSPGIEAMPGDFQVLPRPSIHLTARKPVKNLYSDSRQIEVNRTQVASQSSVTNERTKQQTGSLPERMFTPIQDTLGRPAHSRMGYCPNASASQKTQDSFLPLYEKTFDSSRLSRHMGVYGASSVIRKRQLEEKETYKQLLKQFSTTTFNGMFTSLSTSTPNNQTRAISRRDTPRHIPVITLDSTLRDPNRSLNRSAIPLAERSYTFKKFQPEETKIVDKSKASCETPVKDGSLVKTSNSPYLLEDWIKDLKDKFSQKARVRASSIATEQRRINDLEEKRLINEKKRQERIQERLQVARREAAVIEDDPYVEEEPEADEFPALTSEMEDKVDSALVPNPQMEILCTAFKIEMRRKDMSTLAGLNWLNDEVINLYLSMLVERGSNDNFASVHTFNTFFYPKLLNSGYTSIRRWTKRVDIFGHEILLIPIHLGMHWCLATIDFKRKGIFYYDSMGGNNHQCLNALKQYLCDESLDKKKVAFDLSGWVFENVKGIPEQLNGSDCGMFACKYAEYITRRAEITFTQDHMPYFRRRMVYEILTQQLL